MSTGMPQGRPTGIPADLTAFVGRRVEVSEVRRLLSTSRLVTLTGVGGVGKTRLALRLAGLLARAFPDGVHFVELANVRASELLAQSIAAKLGLQNQSGQAPIDVVAGHARHRRLLLVLDNCEHLVDACAHTVDTLLRAAPGLHVLTTSRHVLGVTGEQAFTVPPLKTPGADSKMLFRELSRLPSVVLFEQRAAAVLPGFAVTPDNARTVGQLVHRLDGLPLAIELAAARMRSLNVSQILERLEDRFILLTGGSRAALSRQRTLRALMDWSYALCSDNERELWARISVFAGGFDLAAAEAVCASDDLPASLILELIQALVEKSILTRHETAPQEPRYRMLETVREYGQERLVESGQLHTLCRRHRDHYLGLAAQAQAHWFGPRQIAWLARLRGDHTNLRAALGYCLSTPGEVEAGFELAVIPRHYWITLGSFGEGRHWLSQLLAADHRDSPARTVALGAHAYLCVIQGAVEEGLAVLDEYRRAAEAQHDQEALAWIEHHLGLVAAFRVDAPLAAAQFEKAVALHRERGDIAAAAECMFKLAIAVCLTGDLDRAMALCQECKDVTTAHGEAWITADTLFAESLVNWYGGDPAAADALAREAISLMQPLNDRWGIALCVEIVAWSAAAAGQAERAAHLLGVLQSLWESIGGAFFAAPFMVEPHRQCEKTARAALTKRSFAQACRRGAKWDFEASVGYVIDGDKDPVLRRGDTPERRVGPLTKRERDVAELVAAGMTNKEIAAKLVIAQRTAENHVERILAKLGFTSRAQLAVWTYEQRTLVGGP